MSENWESFCKTTPRIFGNGNQIRYKRERGVRRRFGMRTLGHVDWIRKERGA